MLIKLFRILYKLFFSLLIVIFFILTSGIIFLIPAKTAAKRKKLMASAGLYDRFFLKTLSVKVSYKGLSFYEKEKSYYIMGNHMTFVDIFTVVSLFQTLFITSNELKKRPVLGQLAYCAGCLFVERRKITTLKQEIPRIGNVLKSGLNICLFPEATCSNGRGLLPFRGGLIEAVLGTGIEVLPVCITYRKINGRDIKKSDYRSFGYFEGMKFPPQFFKLLMLKSLAVQMEVLPPVATDGKERKEIRDEVFNLISSAYSEYLATVDE